MAPSPEHDNEPKAPDKSDSKKSTTGASKLSSDLLDLETASSTDQESNVSTLDDGQLKDLLDEALNYKCPKDRDGKSKLFNVLLKEAEEDERNARAASASGPQLARYYNTSAQRHRGRARNHQQSIAESITHGGSLQNLAQPELFDNAPYLALGTGIGQCRSRRGTSGKKGTVSSRQREGGSLPSNVNSTGGGRGFASSFENHRTKMSVEMVPLNRSDQNRNTTEVNTDKNTNTRCGGGDYIIDLTGHVDPEETKSLLDHDVLSHNYEAVNAPYQHDCPSQQEEQMPAVNKIRYTSPRTNIDTPISFSQLSTSNSLEGSTVIGPLQLEPSYNCVKSIVDNTSTSETKSESLPISASMRSTSFRMTAPSNHSLVSRQQFDVSMGPKKTFDENGNAVSTESNGKTKKKKPKTDRKVTIYQPENVVGHRADIIEDIDQLVKYVESNDAEGTNSSAKRGAKHQQRRSTSGRTLNNKGNKQSENSGVKKSNSLEEISTSKLEDLVSSKGDRRSWGTEDGEQYYCKKIQLNQDPIINNEPLSLTTDTTIEMADFQVVNKKKKSRKRRSDTVSGTSSAPSGGLPREDSTKSRNRRKSSCSMPVSDKSDSSDLDSVHSLPVSAKFNNVNVNSSPKEKQISPTPFLNSVEHFPELCRDFDSVHNIPVSTKFTNVNSLPKETTQPFLNSVEHFPELCRANNNNSNNVNNVNVHSVSVRPAVIIPVSNKDPFYEVSELTFGFEVNEQLLALDNEMCCDSDIKSNSAPRVCNADSFMARFVAPVIEFNYNHDKIVSYVGQEWDKIVHQPGSKVKYYSGQ